MNKAKKIVLGVVLAVLGLVGLFLIFVYGVLDLVVGIFD